MLQCMTIDDEPPAREKPISYSFRHLPARTLSARAQPVRSRHR